MVSKNDVRTVEITIILDKERKLVFDLNAFCELEDKYGTVNKALEALNNGSMKAIRTLLWSGLKHEDETLTEIGVGSLITLQNIGSISETITNAIAEALPDAPKNQQPSPPEM